MSRVLVLAAGQYDRGERQFDRVGDYEARNVSKKLARIILSYVDYVNEGARRKRT